MRPVHHHLLLLLLSVASALLHPANSRFLPDTHQPHHLNRRGAGHHRGHGHNRGDGHHLHQPQGSDIRLRDICARTDYPDICFNSVRPYASAYPVIDPTAVLGMLIRASTARTRAAAARAARIASNPQTSSVVASNLRSCKGSYSDALDGLSSAANAVSARDSGTAGSMLSGCITSYGDCDDSFVEVPATNPMAAEDELLVHMASNCLAILQVLYPFLV